MTVRTYGNIGTFLDEFVTEDIQKVAAQIDRELVMETPKDTVQAAGNWLVTVGTPSDATPNTNSAGAAITQGQSAINSLRPRQKLYIQNLTPYIQRLDEGHSLQAPRGFIQRIITRAVNLP